MARPEMTEVVGAVTRTVHDGKNMIVLKKGKKATVAVSSLPFLRAHDLIERKASTSSGSASVSAARSALVAATVAASAASRAHTSATAAKPSTDEALGEARKNYRAIFGKNAGPKWSVADIEAKIAERQTENGGRSNAGDSGDAEPLEGAESAPDEGAPPA